MPPVEAKKLFYMQRCATYLSLLIYLFEFIVIAIIICPKYSLIPKMLYVLRDFKVMGTRKHWWSIPLSNFFKSRVESEKGLSASLLTYT